ncbi:DUF3572 domain-containing protein [Sphingomonas endophytica]|uniref:DUF3572 domain-containing protein n=1 Tax=Sphingomonas endophytica TaxID=869719 RepID=A0A147I855_9SPHN|nr:DUF3572 domain-containing protein [Sphingomonas endophytica]KTT75337.1 hypothetical protein NS334_03560 [Sphingomonas endophytica]
MTYGAINRDQAVTIALNALSFVLNDSLRADRFIGVTGLIPDNLRNRLEDPATLAAILSFLEGHEPDLMSCADALGNSPADLVAARHVLERAA